MFSLNASWGGSSNRRRGAMNVVNGRREPRLMDSTDFNERYERDE